MNANLKDIEKSLMGHEKTFGLLCIMGYHDQKLKKDVDEYLLCTAIFNDNTPGVAVGCGVWIKECDKIVVTAKDLVDIFDLFRKCKKELICDLHEDVNTFDINKYVERIKLLQYNRREK